MTSGWSRTRACCCPRCWPIGSGSRLWSIGASISAAARVRITITMGQTADGGDHGGAAKQQLEREVGGGQPRHAAREPILLGRWSEADTEVLDAPFGQPLREGPAATAPSSANGPPPPDAAAPEAR